MAAKLLPPELETPAKPWMRRWKWIGLALFAAGLLLQRWLPGPEALNGADEEFGEDRLIAALAEAHARSPEMIYRHVVERVRDWQGDLPQHDDITLIVARVEGASS